MRVPVQPVPRAVEILLPGQEIFDQLAAPLGDVAEDGHQLLGLVRLRLRLLLYGHVHIPYHPTPRARRPSRQRRPEAGRVR